MTSDKTGPSPQMRAARRLLAHESALGSADECATAAGRVYDKLHAHLDPIMTAAVVQALLARSAELTHREFSFLEVAAVEDSTKLCECLQAQDSALAMESASTLFGTFFSLVAAFVGEQLTTQVLRTAWPTMEETAPGKARE